jgi:hypothetical protein
MMTDAEPDPKRAKFPLAEQAEEANRELGLRYRVYSARVAANKMTQAEADRGIALMRAIRDTLRLFARFEDRVRGAVADGIEQERIDAEVEELKQNPAVQAVLAAFPGAEVSLPEQDDELPFDLPEREEHAA